MDVKVCSYNCCSLRKNIDIIRKLTDMKFDVVFLQETYVVDEKLGDLDYIDEHYDSIGVGAFYSEVCLSSGAGRPQGGLACLWRRDSCFIIDKVIINQNMCIMCISTGNFKTVLVNVYLNSDVWETRTQAQYLESLNKMESILADYVFDQIYYIGDFNADPFIGRAWKNLKEFMVRNAIKCYDVDSLSNNTITFISHDNSHCKWLDHVIGRDSQNSCVRDIKVHSDLIGSDHLPLSAVIHIESCHDKIDKCKESSGNSDFINWESLKEEELKSVETIALSIMGNFLDYNVTCCHKIGCMDVDHIAQIERMYKKMVDSVRSGSYDYVQERRKKDKFKIIPGWNRRVKAFHAAARKDYLKWVEYGRDRESPQHEIMVNSKKIFKKALNNCKIDEFQEICNSIEDKFRKKNYVSFWKEIRLKKSHTKRSNIIDGKSEICDILAIFSRKFLCCENEGEERENESVLLNKIKGIWNTSSKFCLQISSSTIRKYCNTLKSGMGHDGIHSHFLKNVSESFLENLAHFINSCSSHCFFPGDLLKGDINPTIKDLKGNVTESANYRPVMQSSCLLKIVEMHILKVLEEKINLNNRQFGFKKGSSTADACFLLKEVVHNYTKDRGKAFVAFVDLSKAFDKVDHFLLGQKLLERNIPPDLVLLLMQYLRNQQARVCWNEGRGHYSYIDKGVRQGGILSPFLFKLYIDDLIEKISLVNSGCRLGFVRMNILAYADDLVLISDSKDSLEILYKILDMEIRKLKLIINKNKSKCMIFERPAKRDQRKDLQLGNDTLEVVENYKYLGHNVNSQLLDIPDVKQRLNDFNSKFNSVFRNFKNVSVQTFLFLFSSYCQPEYGLSLWNTDVIFSKQIFKCFETTFSNALKRILGVPVYSSSHIAAEMCNNLLLKHHIAYVQARYVKSVMRSNNELLKLYRPYLKGGYLSSNIEKLFQNSYEVSVWDNDLDVLGARILWVQKHEERRGICHYFGF